MSDWANHLSTIFPEVRLKRYLEMRGADNGPMNMICALPALWAGLLYCQPALDEAWDIVKHWTAAEREKLRTDVAKLGLNAEIRGRRVQEFAREMLKLSRAGLNAANAARYLPIRTKRIFSIRWKKSSRKTRRRRKRC